MTLTFLPPSNRFQFCMNDAGNRVAALSNFGLIPNFFGNDLTKMFRQRYYGDLTLVPKFTTAHKCKCLLREYQRIISFFFASC